MFVSDPLVTESSRRWPLQDAKARLSELVRLAQSDGPQWVTLHGRDAVAVISAGQFHQLLGERRGDLLIAAMQALPALEWELAPTRDLMPVRAVSL